MSPGQIDGGKDIFHPGLLRIKAHSKKVLPGVIGYFHDTPESGDGGAHGVGAAASHKPALLYQARHPEIYAFAVHGESSVIQATRPSAFTLPGWLVNGVNKLILLNFAPAHITRFVGA